MDQVLLVLRCLPGRAGIASILEMEPLLLRLLESPMPDSICEICWLLVNHLLHVCDIVESLYPALRGRKFDSQ